MANAFAGEMLFNHRVGMRIAGLVALASAAVLGSANMPLKAQATTGETPSASSFATPAWQITAGGHMSFEVASIRLAKPGTFTPPNFALNIDDTSIPPGGRFLADFPLESYIEFAYKIMPAREQESAMLAGLPDWVKTDHFVIQAEAPGSPTKDQMRLMMQSLLAGRFKLAVHFEMRTEPVLALVIAKPGKTGSRIQPHSQGLPCDAKWTAPPDLSSPSVAPGGFLPECGNTQAIGGPNHTVILGARNVTLEHIADYLGSLGILGGPVADQTGLGGMYDFSLQWTLERIVPPAAGAAPEVDAAGPTLLESLKDQLGLKLKSIKTPIQTLVIDHVEQPSPN